MKTLDLNAYGVQEMSHQEMVETDGGFITKLIVTAVLIMLPLAAYGGRGQSDNAVDAIGGSTPHPGVGLPPK